MRRWLQRGFIAGTVVLLFGLSGFVCQRVSERGRYATAFSTYGAGPEGTRGVYLLSETMAPTERWSEDLGRLPEGGLLVALGSCQQRVRRPLARPERERLISWIERGGVLLVAGVPDYLDRENFGVDLSPRGVDCRSDNALVALLEDEPGASERDAGPELGSLPDVIERDPAAAWAAATEEALAAPRYVVGEAAPLDGVELGMRRPLHIDLDEEVARQTLLRLEGPEGRAVGVRVDRGRGAIVVLASASAFQNRDLAVEQGGVLFARLVGDYAAAGPVMFDEYHLGVGERRSMMRYFRQRGLFPLLLQLLLVFGFVGWRLGARFGRARVEPPPAPAGTASYVTSVGTLYQKAGDPGGAAAVLIRRALDQIGSFHRIDAREPERLAQQLSARHRHDAAAAVLALAEAAPQARRLADFTRRVDELVAAALADGAR